MSIIIQNKSDFQTVIERERARSDRFGHDFSIIVFDVPEGVSEQDIGAIIHLIRKRIRIYDELGAFEGGRIMVLMPYADYDQARALADAINEALRQGRHRLTYSIVTYPGHSEKSPDKAGAALANAAWSDIARQLRQTSDRKQPGWKRCMDLLGAACGLVLLSPVMLMVAVFIKAVSPGPVLFKQARLGFRGKAFDCYKFRTMHPEASCERHSAHISDLISSDDPMLKLDGDDPRIIAFGRLLRVSGLDELPQLFNVLRGDMSLIGPRPCIPYEAREFKPWQCKRFDVMPGITGLWQVSGKNRTSFTEMIRYDIRYALYRNFIMDFAILFKTIPAVVAQVMEPKNPHGGA